MRSRACACEPLPENPALSSCQEARGAHTGSRRSSAGGRPPLVGAQPPRPQAALCSAGLAALPQQAAGTRVPFLHLPRGGPAPALNARLPGALRFIRSLS